jgi:hypothetical protein
VRKTFTILMAAATVVALGGCADVIAVGSTRYDKRVFDFADPRLTIDNHGGQLRLVAGTGPGLEVERSLTGKATRDRNVSWSLARDTLNLQVTCSGFVPDCGGLHIVHVPPGTAVTVVSQGAVRAVAVPGDLTVTVVDDWLRVEDPAGALRLRADLNVDVTGARSTDVTASSTERDVNLAFAAPPTRVDARSRDGSVTVDLPAGPETYRVLSTGGTAVVNDPASTRSVVAQAAHGGAHVRRN